MAARRGSLAMAIRLVTLALVAFVAVAAGKAIGGTEERRNSSRCYPMLFAFGDSLTDTGNAQRIFPMEQNRASHSPYGRTFFGRPRDRFCDGRVLIDFIAQALDIPFLSPYIQFVGSAFEHGANFAVSGATATNITFLVPHTLGVQFYWLKRFRGEVEEARKNPHNPAPLPELNSFSEALYVVLIGGNDYNARLIVYNMTMTQLLNSVPVVVDQIAQSIENLYHESARNFLIINVPPVGCTPELLTLFDEYSHQYGIRPEDYDSVGCFIPYNSVLEMHNDVLLDAVQRLRNIHPDAQFIYADYYGATYDVLHDPLRYGLEDTVHSCCGVGGKYNFNSSLQCGALTLVNGLPYTAPSCSNPALAANWDGVHPTEAFNEIIAGAFLQGKYIDPADAFHGCDFDFSRL